MATIRSANRGDLVGMAETHAEAFPGLYATNMGSDFLCAFYECYLSQGIALIAEKDNQIVGLVVGGTQGIRSEFMRTSMQRFGMTFVFRLFTNHAVFLATWKRIVSKIVALTRKRKTHPRVETHDDRSTPAWLQVICVRKRVRGQSVAGDLLNEFREVAKDLGYDAIQLSVAQRNARALAFYNKSGFHCIGDDGDHFVLEAKI